MEQYISLFRIIQLYPNSVFGQELVRFLLDKQQCNNVEQARNIGQELVDSKILVPVFQTGDDEDLTYRFDGKTELYQVQFQALEEKYIFYLYFQSRHEVIEPQNAVPPPVKEDNKILRKSGYLSSLSQLSTILLGQMNLGSCSGSGMS